MKKLVALLALAPVLGVSPALAADRARVDIACKPAGPKLAYDCTFKLSNARTGAALDNAEISVGADMPSMPMAHNVRPVGAKPTGTPGEYAARLALEMYGDWAVRLKVSGPVKDQIVEMKNFNEAGSGPPSRKAGSPRGREHKH